ncbi:MAG TPA: aminotransferase class V-fold PLP-dependent enzyme, partial [Kineosporiaceae bacterium]|nr:aminotransferase class V-fold PLP-dependent enzyme [Kineosporiaceae bacterium]
MTRPGADQSLPRLADLAAVAAPLEPDAAGRRHLVDLAVAHVEEHLAAAPAALTLQPMDGVAAALAAFGVPEEPRDPADVLDVLRRLVDTPGVATTSPRYLGYIPSGGLFSAAVGDFLAAATNRYAGQAAISPGAAGVEHVVARWLADAVGLGPDAGGVLTSGGSAGALIAVVAARETTRMVSDGGSGRPVVYLGEHTHHSLDLALRIAGPPDTVVRRVPVDARHRIDVDALERAVLEDRGGGLLPFLVVGTAGTTNTGAVDPLARIADVAAREGLWFHVDGAYGGLFALCPQGREVLEGIERADSVVVDPHKTLFLPYGIGAVLARDRRVLETVFAPSADYLAPAPAGEPPSPADLGPELTRHFRGLRLWLPLQLCGRAAFAAALSEKVLLARHAHERLRSAPEVEVGPPPDLSIVTFRVPGREPDDDTATAQLAARLRRDGEVFLTTTRIGGRLVLRLAVGSFRTHLSDVDRAVDVVLESLPEGQGQLVAKDVAKPRSGRRPEQLELEFSPGPPHADVLACEADVLGERYGNTPEELRSAYSHHDDRTACLAVRGPSGRV